MPFGDKKVTQFSGFLTTSVCYLKGKSTEISSAEFSDPTNSNLQKDFQYIKQKIEQLRPLVNFDLKFLF